MVTPKFHDSDLEKFAEHLGLTGLDSDIFYESYYNIIEDYDDYESSWEEQEVHLNYSCD
jgi:hypothetical protein